ncbi:MAG: hypothetical protein AAGE89_09405 [Pseudomonadota bacterium]
MNSLHDLGGMDGFGPINPEESEPVFQNDWERRMFGIYMACLAADICNGDAARHAIERLDPAHYLNASYYERWLASLENLLVEEGVVTVEELESRKHDIETGDA